MDERNEASSAPADTEELLDTWNAWAASNAPTSADEGGIRAYRAVFFDLDGTLLPMEIEEFLGTYFKAIGHYVAEQGLDAQAFSAGFKAGIGAMAAHDDGRTNAEAYWEAFFEHVEGGEDAWMPLLNEFYDHDFGAIGKGVEANPACARAIETLAAKGYPLVLATMPMFPHRAVEWRLSWAGVDSARFSRLTSFENSTSVKPKLAYYAENLAACGLRGADVLMVGNNTVEDLAACGLGVDAFLVTDHLLDPTDGFDLASVKHGAMEEFAAWVETLPPCANPATDIEAGAVPAEAREAVLAADASGAVDAAEASRIAARAALGGDADETRA
ncbi:HAD family hydrolase [Gordonibacter sp. 28C]|uniref:HAD family hydrolase n=1 Tax=Gordonibacter sp. 28C TaxID=2078569 RepID=UPI001F547555|nr:HAD family hydrolase [Gordonibacter sp. 28C]